MSHAPKNNHTSHWPPSATIETLRIRAQLIKKIRHFFATRQLWEVETPLLSHTSVPDPFIQSIRADAQYLQTSPEYAMKRLLAAGSGDIFQITKAFRKEEQGAWHNNEFTILEWYRVGWDHHALMDEVDALLQMILNTPAATKQTYTLLFEEHCAINVHTITLPALKQCAEQLGIHCATTPHDRETWLQLLMTHHIEPRLGQTAPFFVYDFPASQAALARLNHDHPPTAARFEVYVKGIELANGFHELQNASEQRKRFEDNLHQRKQLNLPLLPIDEYFLAALASGLPACAGVALGIDRLIMLATQQKQIAQVISFDTLRA